MTLRSRHRESTNLGRRGPARSGLSHVSISTLGKLGRACSNTTDSRPMNRAERGRRYRSGGRLACRRAGHLARRKVRRALVLHGKGFRQAGRPPLQTRGSWRATCSKLTCSRTLNRSRRREEAGGGLRLRTRLRLREEPRFMGSPVGAGAMLTDLEPGIPGGETPPLYGRRDARRYGCEVHGKPRWRWRHAHGP